MSSIKDAIRQNDKFYPKRRIQQIVYYTLIFVADTLEDLFWSSCESRQDATRVSEVDEWDDATIFQALRTGEKMPSLDGESDTRVYKITEDAVVKLSASLALDPPSICQEALTMDLVRTHTTIPVPRTIRVIDPGSIMHVLVMEYVPGKRLDRTWPTLSLWSKLKVAWTMRSYIRQLRKIKSTRPGPPGDAPGPLLCDGHLFENAPRGPFADQSALALYFKNWLACYFPSPSHYNPFDLDKLLVLTHFDLNMRNIILGDDGQVWLIDWAWSGFYPGWFEFMSMTFVNDRLRSPEVPSFWRRCIPFMTDPYFLQERWMNAVP